jgi:hypothetical protein
MGRGCAQLNLYFGECPKDKFLFEFAVFPVKSDWKTGTDEYATGIVRKYLEREASKESCEFSFFYNDGKGLHITDPEVVRSEREALSLIEYAEKNIPGARGTIDLYDCLIDRIRFHRSIKFDGWTENRKGELLDLLKRSGYMPVDEDHLKSLMFCSGVERDFIEEVKDKEADLILNEALVFF